MTFFPPDPLIKSWRQQGNEKQSYCIHTKEDETRCRQTIALDTQALQRFIIMFVVEQLLERRNVVTHTRGMMHQAVIKGSVRATVHTAIQFRRIRRRRRKRRRRRNRRKRRRRTKRRRRARLRVHPRLGRSHAAET